MNAPLIVLRAPPGAEATLARAQAAGLVAAAFPLFAMAPLGWAPPPAQEVDAVLLGSANALRHGGRALALYAGKPAYAVGEATAQAARQARLDVVAVGTGGLQGLMSQIDPRHRRLLRLVGQEHVPLIPPDGVQVTERVVYTALPVPMPDPLARLLQVSTLPYFVVMLHAGATARHLRAECERLGIDRQRILCIAIGPRVAEAAGDGWGGVHSAKKANDDAMLALAIQLCNTTDRGLRGA